MTHEEPIKHALSTFKNSLWVAIREIDVLGYSPDYTRITGSLAAGVLLAQLLYWFKPAKNGSVKLRVKKEGKLVLAKSREEWHKETGLTFKQIKGAMDRLVSLGFVETTRRRFAGKVVVHVLLKEQVVLLHLAALYANSPLLADPNPEV